MSEDPYAWTFFSIRYFFYSFIQRREESFDDNYGQIFVINQFTCILTIAYAFALNSFARKLLVQ